MTDEKEKYPFLSDTLYTAINGVDPSGSERKITRKEATQVSKELIEKLTHEIFSNKRVLLPRLGTITLKETAPRKGRNPRTGEEIKIPGRKRMGLTPASNIKRKLKEAKK